MHGMKLLVTALATSSNSINTNYNGNNGNRMVTSQQQQQQKRSTFFMPLAMNMGSIDTVDEGDTGVIFGRRKALQSIFGSAAVAVAAAGGMASASNALDMDAFANAQIEADTKNCDPKRDPKCAPKMSQAEGLCKYGQSGNARAEACKKFKEEGGTLPNVTKEKSLGGAYAI
eukprot:CAMPEP_0113454606 /NCGR_PEP_ID=MMETSP0014_2-20120614/7948_1 /TAXON_ID=2857 /ORGANISM="Nitzschia sp." /LENGTH=171 /DNA_ID=CAMNT_0000346013 /DNA_START=906 /DNA_END=1421 /DNA_ORIENTATION=+ /assembly_acc=CAM_ASM_000159